MFGRDTPPAPLERGGSGVCFLLGMGMLCGEVWMLLFLFEK